jgi:hypothetical protein
LFLDQFGNLSDRGLLFKVSSYTGWNTNSNTLQTAIAGLLIYNIFGRTQSNLNSPALRYVEKMRSFGCASGWHII